MLYINNIKYIRLYSNEYNWIQYDNEIFIHLQISQDRDAYINILSKSMLNCDKISLQYFCKKKNQIILIWLTYTLLMHNREKLSPNPSVKLVNASSVFSKTHGIQ